MQINLEASEYKALQELVEIGDWVLHAFKTDRPEETTAHGNVLQKLYALAREAGCEDRVQYDPNLKEYFPAGELDKAAMQYIDEYDNDIFWDELTERLAQRDLEKQHGQAQMPKLPFDKRFDALELRCQTYADEFHENGLANLRLVKPAPAPAP
jgi:hypothetical protein